MPRRSGTCTSFGAALPEETVMLTFEPDCTDANAFGSCAMTLPAGTESDDSCLTSPSASPSERMDFSASACLRDTTLGTVTVAAEALDADALADLSLAAGVLADDPDDALPAEDEHAHPARARTATVNITTTVNRTKFFFEFALLISPPFSEAPRSSSADAPR